MDPVDAFHRRIQTERKARKYLRKGVWKTGHKCCTRCRSYRVYQIVTVTGAEVALLPAPSVAVAFKVCAVPEGPVGIVQV